MSAEVPAPWPILNLKESRLLGVLVEKAKTTPDTYPLSMNSLVTASNQKSNRDPILNLSNEEVEETLEGLQKKGLVIKITGGRVERWRHNLYETWTSNKVELAILAELLLRGPQTEGELRGRASRMEPIEDLETLRGLLKPLAGRGLVSYLSPEGRRGTTVTHGFHAPEELKYLRNRHPAEDEDRAPEPAPRAAAPPAAPGNKEALQVLEERLAAAYTEIAELRQAVAKLRETVADLAGQLRGIKEALGV